MVFKIQIEKSSLAKTRDIMSEQAMALNVLGRFWTEKQKEHTQFALRMIYNIVTDKTAEVERINPLHDKLD